VTIQHKSLPWVNRGEDTKRNLKHAKQLHRLHVPRIGVKDFGPHDLRRTCAKLCRKSGGDLEQIKFLLGHSSIQTTERYLGSELEIAVAVQ
jgi:integrase